MKKFSFLICLLVTVAFAYQQVDAQSMAPEEALKKMEWRAIGPANMGGRVSDIDGVPGDPTTFYISGANGGIHKTTEIGRAHV